MKTGAQMQAGQHHASISEFVSHGPLPSGLALDLVQGLARSTQWAHQHGRTTGCREPRRIAVEVDHLVVRSDPAIPAPRASAEDDVRGLGAILYALLTGYWPLETGPDDRPTGLPAAPRGHDGAALAPATLRPELTLEVSELALAALGTGDARARLRTAGAMVRVIEDIRENWAYDLLPPEDATGSDLDRLWRTSTEPGPVLTPPDTRRRASAGLLTLAVLTLLVFGFLGMQAASLFGLTSSGPPRIVVPPGFDTYSIADPALAAAAQSSSTRLIGPRSYGGGGGSARPSAPSSTGLTARPPRTADDDRAAAGGSDNRDDNQGSDRSRNSHKRKHRQSQD